MRETKAVKTESTREQFVRAVCDLCGKETHSEWLSAPNWAGDMYAYDTVEIVRKDGWSYPDGGWGMEAEFDICGQCWTDVLLPFLAERGAKPAVRETDW